MNVFYWIAVAAVIITSSSRLTRLATWDKFPPVAWLRDKYADLTDGNGWQLLAFCGYCASFWITALVVLWAYLAGVLTPDLANPGSGTDAEMVWWLVNGTFGASYLAAILMANDGDDGDDGDDDGDED